MDRNPPSSAERDREARAGLERRVRGGANWFFWIAGLSVLNSLAFLSGGDWGIVSGLGASEVFHALAGAASIEGGASGPWLLAFAVVADLFAAGVLAVAGLFARRRIESAFVLGTAFYTLDGLLFLFSPERLPVAFHAAALAGICVGYAALRRLRRLKHAGSGIATAAA